MSHALHSQRSRSLSKRRRPGKQGFDGIVSKDGDRFSRLARLTDSTVRKQQMKKVLPALSPFRAGGGSRSRSEIANRRLDPGLHENAYDSALLSEREDNSDSSNRRLYGPFVPTSSKPHWMTLAPMSYRRLPNTVQMTSRPAEVFRRRSIQTAPDTLGTSTSGLSGMGGEFQSLYDSRPTTAASSTSPVKKGRASLEVLDTSELPSHIETEDSIGTATEMRSSIGGDGGSVAEALRRENMVQKSGGGSPEKAPKSPKSGGSSPEKSPKSPMAKRFSVQETMKEGRESIKQRASEMLPFSMTSSMQSEQNRKMQEELVITDEIKVFRRFQDDGTVHVDDLIKCLKALGFLSVHEDWVPGLLKHVTNYSQCNMDNFLRFINAYTDKQTRMLKLDFKNMDTDEDGTLSTDELGELLHSWGIIPMSHVLQEVLDEVDEDGTGNLDFDEFVNVVYLLRLRQGFSRTEYEEITSIFLAFDRLNLGTMDTSDVRVALDWLGFAIAPDQVASIIADIDLDGSGRIDELEWLTGMRKVREAKVAELQSTVKANDIDGDGNIGFDELMPILCHMGYFPDDQAVREAAFAAGIAEDHTCLDISELWQFMKVYRDHEGLTSGEVEEIGEGFRHVGVDPKDEVNAVEIGKIVRSIGYMLPFDVQQNLIARVDIDGSGALDQREFRKMIRLINQQDSDVIRMAFREAVDSKGLLTAASGEEAALVRLHRATYGIGVNCKSDAEMLARMTEDPTQYRMIIPGDSDFVSIEEAHRALTRLGCVDINGKPVNFHTHEKVGPDLVDIYGFSTVARRSRQAARAAFRETGGFCKEDIVLMEEKFKEFDADASGELSGKEIIKVLEAHFPTLAKDPSRRPLIKQLLQEADADGNGQLDFQDFLRLMRQVKDIQDQLMIGKELRAIEETRFSPSEVLEFRELLLAVRTESGFDEVCGFLGVGATEVGFEDVRVLLGAIVPMGARNCSLLKVKYNEVAGRQSGVEGSEDKLDFPEFLWLMRELLDSNFANMSDRVNALVEVTVPDQKKGFERSGTIFACD